jgi:hypothetical protein
MRQITPTPHTHCTTHPPHPHPTPPHNATYQVGHARTPWTVKFHPQDSTLLCSGCIGGEVRLWSLPTGRCLRAATLDLPVISLAFHPGTSTSTSTSSTAGGVDHHQQEQQQQHLLAVATFHSLYLWPYARLDQPYHEWQSARLLRCVLFPPGGTSILLGLGNDSGPPRPPRPSPPHPSYHLPPPRPGPKAFHLFLWAFDADKALVARSARPPPAPARPTAPYGRERTPAPPAYASPLSRPRPVLERALLYNDGGVDVGVGPGGQAFLVACAELPPSDLPPVAGEGQQQQQQQGWPLRPYLVKVALPSAEEGEEQEAQGEGQGQRGDEEEEEAAPAWAADERNDEAPTQQPPQQEEESQSPRRLLPPVLAARPVDGVPPGGVTSVKLSGSGRLVLMGYGVRDAYGGGSGDAAPHPVLDVFEVDVDASGGSGRGAQAQGFVSVATVRTREDEDANIARFHPFPAQGFLYGTKQGRLRVFMPGGRGGCRRRRGPGLVVDNFSGDEEEEEGEEEG